MAVSALAVKAIHWIVKAFRFYRSRRTEFNTAIVALRAAGIATKQLEKFSDGLKKVEETVGAHTHAWPEIALAARGKRAPELTAADAKYLNAFKKLFDKTIKKRFA